MRAKYLNFSRMFDLKRTNDKTEAFLSCLQTITNIQLVQLLQLENRNSYKYNEISLFVQFTSISGNVDVLSHKWIVYFLTICHVLLAWLIYFVIKGRMAILRITQHVIIIYCSILEFPIISLMIQFILKHEDFRQNLIILIAAINILVYIIIQILQYIFGKSFSIDIHNNFTPLIDVELNSIIRLYKILLICIGYIINDKLTNFSLITLFSLLQMYQESRFISSSSFSIVQIFCQQMICHIIYFDISIVWSIILIMLAKGISTQYHNYLYYDLLSNQSQNQLNIAYVCQQLSQNNRYNLIEQHYILKNHKCYKCNNLFDMQICILKKLHKTNPQDMSTNLIFCDKFSKLHPIKSLINLIKYSSHLRFDYKVKYGCKINDLKEQIIKIQTTHEQREESNILNVETVLESVEIQQIVIAQYKNIIKEQIKFWNNVCQGIRSFQECSIQIKNLSRLMIENKRNLVGIIPKANLNVIEMKLLQLHNAVVYFDQKKIYLYQKQIDDKLMMDRYRLDKNINNKTLHEGRYLLVQTSIISQKGLLINFNNQRYKQFYNLPNDAPDQIKYVEDLMPSFKRSTHNKFLDNYIRKGYTSFDVRGLDIFICNPEGYITMANLQVSYDNSRMDDFIITGLISKEQDINKAILFSIEGQIYGMDKGTFNIIKNNLKANMTIQELVLKGQFIQAFIRNIQKNIDLLNQKVQSNQYHQLLNINDQWVTENYYQQYEETLNQIVDHDQNAYKNAIGYNNNIGSSVVYNLYFVKHDYKGGQMCYLKLIVQDQEDNVYKKKPSNQSQSNNSRNSQSKSNQASSMSKKNDNRISIQISQLNQKYKFFSLLLSQNQQHDIVPEEVLSNQKEINEIILTPRYQQDDQLIKSAQNQVNSKRDKVIKERIVEQSLSSQRTSVDTLYSAIINNLYGESKLVKPLRKISYVLALIIMFTIIIIFVNQTQIQNSVNVQLAQTQYLRKPQNITYVYSSLSVQILFKYANYKGIIQLSPFMIYWNQIQQIYMQEYIESLIVPLNIEVPIMANSFNKNTIVEHFFIQDEQYEVEVSLQQFYDQVVQYFYLLKDDSQLEINMKSLMNEGFLRENLIKLFDLNNYLLKQIDKIVTNLQQSEINMFVLLLLIQLSILIVFYNIQFIWWRSYDKIITEIIYILHRTQFSQVEKKIQNLSDILDTLQKDDGTWIQSPIQNILFDSDEKEVSQRKQQLISVIPQDYYINKINIIICITILVINILFNVTGYILYRQLNTTFQSSLFTMSNYIQFLHDSDYSILCGAFIKLDGPINGDKSYLLDQVEIINALYNSSNQLLPKLNYLQEMIYSSGLKNNEMFHQLLFKNLCDTAYEQLVMCNPSKINQQYWDKDSYIYLIQNGIIGFTNQFVKFVTENYQHEFNTLSYTNQEQSQLIVEQAIFQNLFLQYYLDIQETLRIFLSTFYDQNTMMGLNIISQLQGYYIGFGIFFVLLNGISYYFWIRYNQHQVYLSLQIIGIIPNSNKYSQNFRSQVLSLYKSIY